MWSWSLQGSIIHHVFTCSDSRPASRIPEWRIKIEISWSHREQWLFTQVHRLFTLWCTAIRWVWAQTRSKMLWYNARNSFQQRHDIKNKDVCSQQKECRVAWKKNYSQVVSQTKHWTHIQLNAHWGPERLGVWWRSVQECLLCFTAVLWSGPFGGKLLLHP